MRVLVTGGTGSFGHAAVDRFLKRSDINEVVLFSRDEEKQHRMRQEYSGAKKLSFVIGDVRDPSSVRRVMRGIDVVFHAAALKQVPTGEFFPWELVKTNIMGTQNVVDAAIEAGIRKMILLSTDKAVQPINAMGMSKAIAEKIITAASREQKKTTFCAVRYGNVAASRGSVIPLFVERLKVGKSLPITMSKMTRFMLSLDDAIDLVELAVDKGQQGDIFIKKSPAATIGDLGDVVLELFNSKVGSTIVGIREGEKIHETLAHSGELMHAQDLGTHFRIRTKRLNEDAYFRSSEGKQPKAHVDYTSETTERMTKARIEKFLRGLPYVQKELQAQKGSA